MKVDFLKVKNSQSFIISIMAIIVLSIGINISQKNVEPVAAATITEAIDQSLAIENVQVESESTHRTAVLAYGSNLNNLLIEEGLSREDAAELVYSLSNYVDPRSMKAGVAVELTFQDKELSSLTYPLSTEWEVVVKREGNSPFISHKEFIELNRIPLSIEASVSSSLYGSALDKGVPDTIIMELIQLLSFDVDFQRDIQRGDQFSVTYESIINPEGEVVDSGNILFVEFHSAYKDLEIYRYTDLDGKSDYYNQEGQTVRKTLLKTPINGAYITSNYGMRVSPISGYNKMHKGIDFGAPRGTPIKVSGDGVVESAYYNNVYGNHITVRHTNSYKTMYAHMTSFASGIRKGSRVDQGQTIGYVGSTGMSTGPHLHYEVWYYGRQVNPSSIKFPPGRTLEGENAQLFHNMVDSYNSSLR